jgi:hypothetical protein
MSSLKHILQASRPTDVPSASSGVPPSPYPLLILLLWPIITILYGNAIHDQYAFIRQWTWSNLLWIALAFPFLLFQERVGLPSWHGKGIPVVKKWLIPAAIGLGFAILDVLVIKVIMHPEPYETLPPYLQPFPYSVFLYPSGALDIEIFYRLIPITLAAWAGKQWFSWKNGQKILWTVVILASFREPLEQLPGGPAWLIAYSFLSGLAMNLVQGICMVRYGFLSALAVRIGHYMLWHIGLGIYVQYVEHARL